MSRASARTVALDPPRLVRLYGLLVGAGLLLEGGLLLVVEALRAGAPNLSLPFATGDTRHNALHVVWGVVLVVLLATSRAPARATLLALAFGVFYTVLAIAGVLVDRPFGLLLGPGENGFHFTVGLLALALGAWSAARPRRPTSQPASSSSSSDNSVASVSSARTGSGGSG